MKIAIVTSHVWPVCWPIPHKSRSGDFFCATLAATLDEMGHNVTFIAPEGSYVPPNGQLLSMPGSEGQIYPSGIEYERQYFEKYFLELNQQDIVHDFSNNKYIADTLYAMGHTNVLSTILGGAWHKSTQPHNVVAVSNSQRDRLIMGVSDYYNTPTPGMDGASKYPIDNPHVVHLGIDTQFYTPTYNKKDFFLWFGRWHPVRGYKFAIELARKTGIELVMAGCGRDNEYQKNYLGPLDEALELAKGLPNVHFEWLPEDPDHHTAKRELLRNAKAFLYTVQFQEPFGLTQIESLACGTPVIGTNYGSVPEIITDRVTGFVCDNNIDAFAQAIKNIDIIKPKTCRESAVKYFDRDVMTKKYLQEYRFVLNGNKW